MTINICIAGLGNVGSEVVRSLSINNNYEDSKFTQRSLKIIP